MISAGPLHFSVRAARLHGTHPVVNCRRRWNAIGWNAPGLDRIGKSFPHERPIARFFLCIARQQWHAHAQAQHGIILAVAAHRNAVPTINVARLGRAGLAVILMVQAPRQRGFARKAVLVNNGLEPVVGEVCVRKGLLGRDRAIVIPGAVARPVHRLVAGNVPAPVPRQLHLLRFTNSDHRHEHAGIRARLMG